ncbi:MAG: laccase, multicopper oxidase, benzenediol:oxygen oxidorectuctase [Stictis urceolatum]|nr:laccase, multicopper oxidase, benzenediol:oxygen oxidorectuctase [Stictis urceolata]
MKYSILASLAALVVQATGLVIPAEPLQDSETLVRRQNSTVNGTCEHTATSRGCWGDGFDIDTDYYTSWPDTGVTREFTLEVTNTTMAPDGYERTVLSCNGEIPGPAITADWGDDIVIHVKNSMKNNGTSIHWHGVRQLLTSEADGVPGVTQCPIQPGDTMTYRFKATQYGSSWYHSHFTLQLGDGLFGPINIRGPATADYDEDLGTLFLQDWGHQTTFNLWTYKARHGGPPTLPNGLVNGTNVFDCSTVDDSNCKGTGKRFETSFKKGTKYLIRLVNSALDGYIKFAIDSHKFTVIANDFVPIKPYDATSVLLGIGQRYDVVVEASEDVDNYWLRAVWMTSCSANTAGTADNILGIIRYDGSDESADPETTKDPSITTECGDESATNLVPHVSQTVGSPVSEDVVDLNGYINATDNYFYWTINSSSLVLEWENPTELMILNSDSPFPTDYNIYPVTVKDQWVYWIIQAPLTGFGLAHPIHLHGHDFFVIGQESAKQFDPANPGFKLDNPVRRDVATLPPNGYLAIAFYTDNPGSWLIHCHIAWHASQGLALQFVERESEIAATIDDPQQFKDTCAAWNTFEQSELYPQDDSGI